MARPVELVRVLYDYDYVNQDGGQISIRVGEEYVLVKKSTSEWWYVLKKGTQPKQCFYVPANYVEPVTKAESSHVTVVNVGKKAPAPPVPAKRKDPPPRPPKPKERLPKRSDEDEALKQFEFLDSALDLGSGEDTLDQLNSDTKRDSRFTPDSDSDNSKQFASVHDSHETHSDQNSAKSSSIEDIHVHSNSGKNSLDRRMPAAAVANSGALGLDTMVKMDTNSNHELPDYANLGDVRSRAGMPEPLDNEPLPDYMNLAGLRDTDHHAGAQKLGDEHNTQAKSQLAARRAPLAEGRKMSEQEKTETALPPSASPRLHSTDTSSPAHKPAGLPVNSFGTPICLSKSGEYGSSEDQGSQRVSTVSSGSNRLSLSSTPAGWRESVDDSTGDVFFINDVTKEMWSSAVDSTGRTYFYKDGGSTHETAWQLPEIRRVPSVDSALSALDTVVPPGGGVNVRSSWAAPEDYRQHVGATAAARWNAASLKHGLNPGLVQEHEEEGSEDAANRSSSSRSSLHSSTGGGDEKQTTKEPGADDAASSSPHSLPESPDTAGTAPNLTPSAAVRPKHLALADVKKGSLPAVVGERDSVHGSIYQVAREIIAKRHSVMITMPQERSGMLLKTKLMENGKKVKKNWSQSYVVTTANKLYFYKDQKSAQPKEKWPLGKPEATVDILDAHIDFGAKEKSSKKHVVQVVTATGTEYLLQAADSITIHEWYIALLNNAKAVPTTTQHSPGSDSAGVGGSPSPGSLKTGRKLGGLDSPDDSLLGPAAKNKNIRERLLKWLVFRPALAELERKGYIKERVFGSTMAHLYERDRSPVPAFVSLCIEAIETRGLKTDGIYRVSGNLAQIQKLRFIVDSGDGYDLNSSEWEIHVLTGALKYFFRELKEPLFPFSLFDAFISAISKLQDRGKRLKAFKDLIRQLPTPNRETLKVLLQHLTNVIAHSSDNRMQLQNVAIVFGPTLLWPEVESPNIAVSMVFQGQVVEFMVAEFKQLF